MTDKKGKYWPGKGNGRYAESYTETKKKQNLWRCDCSDDGNHTNINRHEEGCNYALWYVMNFDKGE